MTEIVLGGVDVVVVRRSAAGDLWECLLMRRAAGMRSPGAWEFVHGRMEPKENPEIAAARELGEETGLVIERLYVIGTQSYYLPRMTRFQHAVTFAAVVPADATPVLGPEHDAFEWLLPEPALARLTWPRARVALQDAFWLLRTGDAGPAEDVLRV